MYTYTVVTPVNLYGTIRGPPRHHCQYAPDQGKKCPPAKVQIRELPLWRKGPYGRGSNLIPSTSDDIGGPSLVNAVLRGPIYIRIYEPEARIPISPLGPPLFDPTPCFAARPCTFTEAAKPHGILRVLGYSMADGWAWYSARLSLVHEGSIWDYGARWDSVLPHGTVVSNYPPTIWDNSWTIVHSMVIPYGIWDYGIQLYPTLGLLPGTLTSYGTTTWTTVPWVWGTPTIHYIGGQIHYTMGCIPPLCAITYCRGLI
ncbi:hypothetical protein G9A89_000326 [Geosiphon pyriformis]|nr:hypothetical protein G9A89_000326 [Geosiphon pyriformis]